MMPLKERKKRLNLVLSKETTGRKLRRGVGANGPHANFYLSSMNRKKHTKGCSSLFYKNYHSACSIR